MGEQWASLYTPDGIFEATRPETVIGHEDLAKVPGQLAAHFQGRMRRSFMGRSSRLTRLDGSSAGMIVLRWAVCSGESISMKWRCLIWVALC